MILIGHYTYHACETVGILYITCWLWWFYIVF